MASPRRRCSRWSRKPAADPLDAAAGDRGHLQLEQAGAVQPADPLDPVAEAARRQAAGDPAAVVVVLAPGHVEALAEIEAVEPLVGGEVGQEAVPRGGVGYGH